MHENVISKMVSASSFVIFFIFYASYDSRHVYIQRGPRHRSTKERKAAGVLARQTQKHTQTIHTKQVAK